MTLGRYSSAAVTVSAFALCSIASAFASDAPPKAVKPVPALDNPFFFVNDNRLTYAVAPHANDPGAARDTVAQTIAFTHFDVWKYGTNFVNLIYTKADNRDPASPCGNFKAPTTGCAGATEFVGILRSTLGFNQIFDTTAFSVGPLRGVSFYFGGDLTNQNSFIAPSKASIVGGLQFSFGLPYNGYFNVAPLIYKEWNHSAALMPGFVPAGYTGLPGGDRNFRPSWGVDIGYYMDLGFLPGNMQYFSISGRAGIYGPKGDGTYDGYTLPAWRKTATSINSEPIRLTFDVSKLLWGEKYSHYLETWIAFRYWKNKFGFDDSDPANSVCFTARVNNGSCTEVPSRSW